MNTGVFYLVGQSRPFVRRMPGEPIGTRCKSCTNRRRPMRSPQKRLLSGVTLVELMVSLAVLGIVATVGAASFVDFRDRNRVRGAADSVVSLVSNARAEAVKNHLDVSIAMAGSGTAWCIGGNAAPPPSGGLPSGAADPCDCID